MMSRGALLFAFCLIGVFAANAEVGVIHEGPVVKIAQGDVQGLIKDTRNGGSYHRFKGIPFGKVEKRFGMPKPADNWMGVKKAFEDAKGCINSGFFGGISGSEDCLKLDIYTPTVNSSSGALLPVMCWIYGGGFAEGNSNQYSGEYFMDNQDVVVVIINYRLSALGFLNAGVAGARGNQGMKDQVLALKWIQENIAAFSGDKNEVTIFGESAGAISASLLTFSPMAEGLFHRAIIQSGPAIMAYLSYSFDGPKFAKSLAQRVDCPTSNMEYLVQCLEKIDPFILNKHAALSMDVLGFDENTLIFMPSLETYSEGDNDTTIFMSKDPYDLAVQGNFHKVPIIMGLVGWESTMTASAITKSPKNLKKLSKQWGRYLPRMLYLSNVAEDPAVAATKVREHFVGDKDLEKKDVWEIEDFISDRHWVHPFRTLAELYAKETDLYLYNFTKPIPVREMDPNSPFAMFIPDAEEGATHRNPGHAEELRYIFKMGGGFELIFPNVEKSEAQEYEFSKKMIELWTTFAKTGKPGKLWGSETPDWEPIKGDLYSSKILHLEEPPVMKEVPARWKVNSKFWESLHLKECGGKWESES